MTSDTQVMLELAELRESLTKLLRPEILQELATFLEETGGDNSWIAKHKWFAENSDQGGDCKYAVMAREFFMRDQAKNIAEQICKIYHQWAKETIDG